MARKRPPSVDFFYDDFFAGVADMDPYAVGMYIKTICFQWAHDFVPNDTEKLLRITGATPEKFAKHWPTVAAKFVEAGENQLVNERAQAAMKKRLAVYLAHVEAGKKGGRPRSKPKGSGRQNQKANQLGTQKGRRKTEDGRPIKIQEKMSRQFELFWTAFPTGRKKSKGKAREAFEKAIGFGVDAEMLIRRAEEYAQSNEGQGQYVKMPSTWLNQQCWDDDDDAWNRKESNNDANRRSPSEEYDPDRPVTPI